MSHRFVDEGALGQGGSSLVRRLFDSVLLRHIAMKVLTSLRPVERERFLAEAQITGQLEHPGVIPVHDFGIREDGTPWMRMKLVTGQTLEERIDELGEGRLDPEALDELLAVVVKVCDTLAYAHSRGVLHRDLKPGNVMLGAFGEVYVLDWGIARPRPVAGARAVQTSGAHPPNEVTGTPAYMSPEQVDGVQANIDERTDVYALGGLLYHVLTGVPPHPGRTAWDSLLKSMAGDIERPTDLVTDGLVPPGLERIALRAMSMDPARRPVSAAAFRAEIDAFRRGSWHLPTRSVARGTDIVREGELGDEAYLLQRGRCEVRTQRHGKVRELGPGDVFGEMAVLTDRPRTSTVTALTDVTIQVVTRDALARGMGLDTWSGRFARALARRISEVDDGVDPS